MRRTIVLASGTRPKIDFCNLCKKREDYLGEQERLEYFRQVENFKIASETIDALHCGAKLFKSKLEEHYIKNGNFDLVSSLNDFTVDGNLSDILLMRLKEENGGATFTEKLSPAGPILRVRITERYYGIPCKKCIIFNICNDSTKCENHT